MMVSNSHLSNKPGEHWVFIYISNDGNYGEFFDSFGRPPTDDFNSYMNKHIIVISCRVSLVIFVVFFVHITL